MTLKEKIGQLFLIGTTKKEEIPLIINLIKNNSIGGVVLYKSNYDNYKELNNLINQFKEANKDNPLPLFISIDQEGGRVNRLPLKPIKNAYSFNNLDDSLIIKRTELTSKILNDVGINMNFDPVLDLKLQEDRHAIGNRAYSSNPDEVIKITNLITNTYINNLIIPVIKHFPGQGSLKPDSHIQMPVIKDYKEHIKKDLLPFINHINNDIPALMVGHIKINKVTGKFPATLSENLIKNELRNNLNYNNLIITDELSMRSVRYRYGRRNSVVKSINSGSDIIMYKYYNKLPRLFPYLERLVNKKVIDINSIDDAVERIINIKKKFNINDDLITSKLDAGKLNNEIEELNELVN